MTGDSIEPGFALKDSSLTLAVVGSHDKRSPDAWAISLFIFDIGRI